MQTYVVRNGCLEGRRRYIRNYNITIISKIVLVNDFVKVNECYCRMSKAHGSCEA